MALANVKHQGGVKSQECNKVAHDIWLWCEEKHVWLTIAHVPGIQNELADYKSRHFMDNLEWILNDKIFHKAVQVLGRPEVDLFASLLNRKTDKFVSCPASTPPLFKRLSLAANPCSIA